MANEGKKEVKLTKTMLQQYEERLRHMEGYERDAIAKEIDIARGFGDLSENAEYKAAKEAQEDLERRIAEFRDLLDNAVIISDEASAELEGIVSLGCTVKVRDLEFDEVDVYCIVGTHEANPMEARISDESPMGQALIGKRVGDIAEYEAIAGTVRFEILDINR